MAGKICDCCKQESEDTIVGCGYGPISVAYCPECLKLGKMPWWNLVMYVSLASSEPEHISDQMNEEVAFQCKLHGKTVKQFWKECKEECKKMDEFLKREDKKRK